MKSRGKGAPVDMLSAETKSRDIYWKCSKALSFDERVNYLYAANGLPELHKSMSQRELAKQAIQFTVGNGFDVFGDSGKITETSVRLARKPRLRG